MHGKKCKMLSVAAVALFLILSVAIVGHVPSADADTESRITLSISSYSGEWKADPGNPGLTRPQNAIDGNAGTAWYCQWGKADNCYGDAPSMTLSFGSEKTVRRIEVTMADDFVPQDIKIELGRGGAWAEAGRFDGMAAKQNVVCPVPDQTADKLRVTVMQKSEPDNNGFTLAKIAEIAAYSVSSAALDALPYYTDVTAGGVVLCSDQAKNSDALSDGIFTEEGRDGGAVVTKFYTDYSSDTDECDAITGYRFPSAKNIGKLTLWGASKQSRIFGFPRDFAIVYSPDGVSWYVVPNQIYRDFTPSGGENAFVFDNKISARAVGIKALRSSQISDGGYGISLAEMRVFSSPLAGDAITPSPQDTADPSAITTVPLENTVLDGEKTFSVDLKKYFTCSAGELSFSSKGVGSVSGDVYSLDAKGLASGRYDVTVTASLNDFCRKSLSFTVTVQNGGKMFVSAAAALTERTATTAKELRVNMTQLFKYSGSDSLVFAASEGSVDGSVLSLLYDAVGEHDITVECYPVSDRSLGATALLRVKVTRGGLELSPLTVEGSEYESPFGGFMIAGGIAGGLALAGIAITVILLIRRKTA